MIDNLPPSEDIPNDIPENYNLDAQEVRDAARDSLDVLAALAMPEDATESYPPIFWQIWSLLCAAVTTDRDFSKLAIGLPRGHGKTMFLKIFVIFCVLFTRKKFILIVSASKERAEDVLADITDALDSENIHNVFGNWRGNLAIDRKDFKKFTFNGRPVIIKAIGQQGAMRGIAVKNRRPDVMIFDDAQTPECASSITEATSFQKWFRGTALKAKNPSDCTFIYVGNMYADFEIKKGVYGCMLRNLQQSPSWTSFITGAIKSDGTALWEAVQPIEQLLLEFSDDLAAGTPEIFYAEVLNDPSASAAVDVDISKIQVMEILPEELHQGSFIIIDPANDKKTSDATVLNYFEVHEGIPVSMELYEEKLSGPALVHKTINLCMAKNCNLVFVEAEAYQYSLLGWFDLVCNQLNINNIAFEPLYSKGVKKNSRILSMFKALVKGEIQLSKETYNSVVLQILRFNKLKTNNVDDILDTLAYSEQVMGNHADKLIVAGSAELDHEAEFRSLKSPDEYADRISSW